MTRVSVNRKIINWAMERSGRSVDELAQRFPRISKWLSGEESPTLRQLESIAKITSTPLGYFFLDRPPKDELPIPHYRTIKRESRRSPSPDLIETIHTMQRRQSWMRDYLRDEQQEPLQFVGSASVNDAPKVVANSIRGLLNFDSRWASQARSWSDALRTLRESMELAGILVVVNGIVGNNTHRKLDPEEFRGFVLVDDLAPLVFVNGADAKAALMFTLGHELAHLFLGKSAAFDLRRLQPAENTTEKLCDAVAAEFLVPEDDLRLSWPQISNTDRPFLTAAKRFKVSELVAARRALDLRLIGRTEFGQFYGEYMADARRRQPKGERRGDFYKTQALRVGRRFASAVISATREGRLLYSDAFRMTGMHGKTFEEFASRLESGGAR